MIELQVFVCEAMFFLLEYFKTVAFGWMFLEGFYLHNQLVFTVFNSEPRLTPYLIAGYGSFSLVLLPRHFISRDIITAVMCQNSLSVNQQLFYNKTNKYIITSDIYNN